MCVFSSRNSLETQIKSFCRPSPPIISMDRARRSGLCWPSSWPEQSTATWTFTMGQYFPDFYSLANCYFQIHLYTGHFLQLQNDLSLFLLNQHDLPLLWSMSIWPQEFECASSRLLKKTADLTSILM